MPRRGSVVRRAVFPDRVYGDCALARFINCVMWRGKKSVAEKIVYTALVNAADKLGLAPLNLFHRVIDNVKPLSECVSRRVGGTSFSVPRVVRDSRGVFLANKMLISAARNVKGKPMHLKLEQEFINAYNCSGVSYKKKEEMHKMAHANMSSAHFRW